MIPLNQTQIKLQKNYSEWGNIQHTTTGCLSWKRPIRLKFVIYDIVYLKYIPDCGCIQILSLCNTAMTDVRHVKCRLWKDSRPLRDEEADWSWTQTVYHSRWMGYYNSIILSVLPNTFKAKHRTMKVGDLGRKYQDTMTNLALEIWFQTSCVEINPNTTISNKKKTKWRSNICINASFNRNKRTISDTFIVRLFELWPVLGLTPRYSQLVVGCEQDCPPHSNTFAKWQVC